MAKRRTGIATVIGSLIFIAILMTSVIPMYLSMKEADTKYNQKQAEMVKADQDRQRELVSVMAQPIPDTTKIKITAMTRNIVPIIVYWTSLMDSLMNSD